MQILPRDHTDYIELETCPCQLCTEYRGAVVPYLESVKLVEQSGHNVRCVCDLCRKTRKLNTQQLAADAKRTLWSEAVFTAEGHSWGPLFLEWVENRILFGGDTTYFWVQESEGMSMDNWIEMFIEQVGESEIRISAAKLHSEDKTVAQALTQSVPKAVHAVERDAANPELA